MRTTTLYIFIILAAFLYTCQSKPAKDTPIGNWQIGPFVKVDSLNPILGPLDTKWYCPVRQDTVLWQGKDIFNPCAVVKEGKVYLLYRAEDFVGQFNGTSRIGLAVSDDGLHFERYPMPVFYPENDQYKDMEWEGGVEDPRIVEDENGTYYMTYTAYNGHKTRLCMATSDDLVIWRKHGVVFDHIDDSLATTFSFKSGLIVSTLVEDKMIATRINGKYWMYWNVGELYLATSDDLIHWEPVLKDDGSYYAPALLPRPDMLHTDNIMCEPGPAALLTDKGILVFYNGIYNGISSEKGRPEGDSLTWAGVQVLFDAENPLQAIARADEPFIKPEKDYEITGQVNRVTFIEGMVKFKEQWFIYYGTADSFIAVAVANAQ
ncbi:MAG: glycosidase [Cyclobacteriaceae bacterium]|nr:glycosidase [Cyclobacteriaceae bacterium]